jgi:anti-sigma-K factor RskA
MNAGRHTAGQGGCDDADAAAYVLGALTPEENETFRRHLSTCVVCRDEVAALKTVGDALALAVPQQAAPRRLRQRVLADVRQNPRAAGTTAGVRRSRAVFAPAAAAVGGAVALAGVIVAVVVLASGESGRSRTIRARVAAPATAVVRVVSGHAELIVRHMPRPPDGKIYEVWLERDGRNPTPTSALFDVTPAGAGAVDIPGDLHGVREVLVTPERRGGSLAPTHSPVIVARLS